MNSFMACPGGLSRHSAPRRRKFGASDRQSGFVPTHPRRNFAGAGFDLSDAPDEAWWRRGESNPRPHKSHSSFYARVPSLNLILPTADGQAIGRTSGHEMVLPRRAATPRRD